MISTLKNLPVLNVGVALILSAFASCSGYSATGGPGPLVKSPLTVESASGFEPLRLNSVAIYPLGGPVEPQVLSYLDTGLKEAFNTATSLEILAPQSSPEEAFDIQAVPDSQLQAKAAAAAGSLGAQGALCGLVTKMNRDEMGFKLWLLDPGSGKVLWTATYGESRQALTQNLFKLPTFFSEESRPGVAAMREAFADAARALEKTRTERAAAH